MARGTQVIINLQQYKKAKEKASRPSLEQQLGGYSGKWLKKYKPTGKLLPTKKEK